MNKRIILILVIGMAICVSLASAASCTSCHDKKNHKDHEEKTDPCACLCPFEESGFCTPIPGLDIDTGETLISDPTGTVKASFTTDKTTGSVPFTVQFSDTSSGDPNIWGWDFGDGTNSALQNPTHTYTFPGNYSVTFMAKKYTKEGTKESTVAASIIRPDYIVVTGQPSASAGSVESAPVTGSSSAPVQSAVRSAQIIQTPKILQPVIMVPYGNANLIQAYHLDPSLYLEIPYAMYEEYPVSVPVVAYSGKQIVSIISENPSTGKAVGYGNQVTVPFPFLLEYSLKGIISGDNK